MPNNESVINNKDAKINKRVVSGVIVLKVFPCSMRVVYCKLLIAYWKSDKERETLNPKRHGGGG